MRKYLLVLGVLFFALLVFSAGYLAASYFDQDQDVTDLSSRSR